METEKILELMTRIYNDLKAGQEQLRTEMQAGNEQLRAEMRSGQEQLRAEMQAGNEQLRIEMQEGFSAVNQKLSSLDERLSFVEKSVVRIENDHGAKLKALFEGYQLNSEKLDRIESEVARHDEFILRRLK